MGAGEAIGPTIALFFTAIFDNSTAAGEEWLGAAGGAQAEAEDGNEAGDCLPAFKSCEETKNRLSR